MQAAKPVELPPIPAIEEDNIILGDGPGQGEGDANYCGREGSVLKRAPVEGSKVRTGALFCERMDLALYFHNICSNLISLPALPSACQRSKKLAHVGFIVSHGPRPRRGSTTSTRSGVR